MREDKEKYVYRVFQSIADGYDRANRRISLSQHMKWKREAVRMLCKNQPENAWILDIGCGTGDMLGLIKEEIPGAHLTGVDFSPNMLEAARKRFGKRTSVRFMRANALDLPFEDETFDGVSISFALRNTADHDKALEEAFRVLKKGGSLIVIDSFVPDNIIVRPFYRLYFSLLMPLLGGGLGKLREYLWLKKSTEDFITGRELAGSMKKTGFKKISGKSFLFGACVAVQGYKYGQ